MTRITRVAASGTRACVADGYQWLEPLTAVVAGKAVTWLERRLMVGSRQLASAGEAALRARLAKARAAVAALNDRGRGKRRFLEPPALEEAVEAILTRYRMQGLLAVHSTEYVQERLLRRYGSRPATVCVERDVRMTAVVDRSAVAAAVRRLGWRVYATHAPPAQLSLAQAVGAYRHEYLVKRGMGRLKGRPLSVTPMYLERDDRATGLIRLLSVGLRVLTRLECVVRQRRAAELMRTSPLF